MLPLASWSDTTKTAPGCINRLLTSLINLIVMSLIKKYLINRITLARIKIM